ncbi:MAG: hypothetical protein A2Y98_03230 [Candidatus Portnoybacteria bacterium RBG_19FT_COMBO_36_7]|uniref:Type 4 fimbrial biogenesis protein PilX N-terminal domain-containing protein n=1 Tax=Candidatus Portnoybacteria bacterium RBG_19FT_COMBO_36_7 TaxID=1801992 RepID=A0A1G2F6Q8_9BACT|nr:MAG: hypothetical protein A2Y98_03230 [Candidatus Portnoybacteria bacterium RBG_19FT_COMBO_36_7]
MNKTIFENKNKGATAIILTFIIITVTLLIASGLSLIFLGEIKQSRLAEYTISAFYAADSGVEYALFQIVNNSGDEGDDVILNLTNKAEATVDWSVTGKMIDSLGFFSGTNRRVQLTW